MPLMEAIFDALREELDASTLEESSLTWTLSMNKPVMLDGSTGRY